MKMTKYNLIMRRIEYELKLKKKVNKSSQKLKLEVKVNKSSSI